MTADATVIVVIVQIATGIVAHVPAVVALALAILAVTVIWTLHPLSKHLIYNQKLCGTYFVVALAAVIVVVAGLTAGPSAPLLGLRLLIRTTLIARPLILIALQLALIAI